MVSKHAFLAGLLLASVAQVLALPHLQARRRASRSSNPDTSSDISANSVLEDPSWAGAMLEGNSGTFDFVTTIFQVPNVSGAIGAAAAAWVGIDGGTCQTGFLQAGVIMDVGAGGETIVTGVYEWLPEPAYSFSDMSISVGDVLRVTVAAFSTTSGIAVIDNWSTGGSTSQKLTSNNPLCMQDAEWIVEDFTAGNSLVPFADFGMFMFLNATASGESGSVGPSGAVILDIVQDGTLLASTYVEDSDVVVVYN